MRHARAEEAEEDEPVLRFDVRERLSKFVLATPEFGDGLDCATA